jgi:hypothetical protein
MSELLELVLDLGLQVLSELLDFWFGDIGRYDTTGARVFWCAVIVLIGGVIFWELR